MRVKSQRVKAAKLGERLQEVRRRVKGWERTEGEWQAKTSRRLRILWGGLLSITILLLVLRYWPGHLVNPESSLTRRNTLPIASNNIATGLTSFHPPHLSKDSMLSRVGQTMQEHTAEAFLSHDQQGQRQSDHSCPDAVRLFDEL